MTGNGRFVQQGAGTTILTGSNSYAGNTTISAGVLQIGNNGTTGNLVAGNVINDAILRFSRSNSITASSLIQGGGSLEQVGAGTTILSANNTYTGATTVSAGVLQIGNGGTTGSLSTSSVITNDGTLAFNRSDNIAQGTHFSGAAINGTGSLLKQGAGMLTLNTNNGYTGLTTISNGVVRIQDSSALGLGGFSGTTMSTIASGSALEIDGSLSLTEHIQVQGSGVGGTGAIRAISGSSSINMHVALMADTTIGVDSGANLNIGGGGYGLYFNGGLTKEGNGTLVLSGDNTYVGNTTVSAGTLLINGSTSSTSLVNVAIGATLGGNGTAGAATTVSGNLNPGNSAGLLTFDDSLKLLSTAVTTMEIDGNNRGTTYDAINIATELTYGGTLSLDLGVIFDLGTYTFDLFNLGSEGAVDSQFTAVSLAGLYSGSLTESIPGSGVWGRTSGINTWTFTESTGDLNLVVIPEPRAALLGGFGLLLLLRRRRH